MRFQSLGAVLFVLASVAPMGTMAQDVMPSDTLTLSLDKCIAIALDENPTIKVADMEINRVDYSKKEIIGQLLPTTGHDDNHDGLFYALFEKTNT